MFRRKSLPQASHTMAPSEDELQRLHEQAVNRRYDLRVCNPAHGGFYAFMARYKDAADDPDALEQLAEEIVARQARLVHDAGLFESFGHLADLARWRARALRVRNGAPI
ncbi:MULTISPECIES: hypothetical protein [Roseiflexus]|uniref:Uncharacterized protein n=1 Tax=Roseiflexus castenholzii (strain DSM 13941 / HLO8) TaxID=383372 RepID=A7NJZ7_ROSCS|nr:MULTISPECIES: hypothetical protein [Roseiflexus]ABU57817.1 conserved hypothetical protein [Roseiflexus castenholzii DSM 13941]GIW00706.1 MAG: hypothetical protein KatS3mg058_2109 [Roseiflexus sp.]